MEAQSLGCSNNTEPTGNLGDGQRGLAAPAQTVTFPYIVGEEEVPAFLGR